MSGLVASRRGTWGRLRLPARAGWAGVAALLLVAYLGSAYLAPLMPPLLNMYLFQPLCWLLPAALAVRLLGGERRALRGDAYLLPLALNIGLTQVGLTVLAGLVFGFGRSPYAHGPLALLANSWYFGTLLVGREVARWFIVRALRERGEPTAVAVTWAILWLTSLAPGGFGQLGAPATAFPYLGHAVLPGAAENLLATYLALLGGPIVALAYLAPRVVFEWFATILPDLPWAVATLIGVVVPLVGLMIAYPSDEATGAEAAEASEERGDFGIKIGWIATVGAIVLVLWFNSGLLGVRPSLISGISMEPTMHTGDIAITRAVAPDALRVGDVVRFRQEGREVLHRIVGIQGAGGALTFTTLGDNNAMVDPTVRADQIEGRLALHIPKVGWPAVGLRILVQRVTGK